MCPQKGLGLRPAGGQARLIEVRGLANRSERLGAGCVDKSEGFANRSEGLGAGLAQGPSIK